MSLKELFDSWGIEKLTEVSNTNPSMQYGRGRPSKERLRQNELEQEVIAETLRQLDRPMTTEELTEYVWKFYISAALYLGVIKGEYVMRGEMSLEDDTATFATKEVADRQERSNQIQAAKNARKAERKAERQAKVHAINSLIGSLLHSKVHQFNEAIQEHTERVIPEEIVSKPDAIVSEQGSIVSKQPNSVSIRLEAEQEMMRRYQELDNKTRT